VRPRAAHVSADAEVVRRAGARDIAARRALADSVSMHQRLNSKNTKFLNIRAQNFEYESCRSHYPLNFHKGHKVFFSTEFA
jgi:hypothetical protein